MDNIVFLAVISAAFLHAFWNFLVKGNDDKAMAMAAVALGHVPFCLGGLVLFGLPPTDALPMIVLSALLHTGYQIFLMNAYRFGGLSQIYPIARGLSPLLLSLASFAFMYDMPQRTDIIGIALVSGALIVFGIFQYRFDVDGPKGLVLACLTGLFIASYSMIDAIGTRIAGNAPGFYGVMSTLNGLLMLVYFLFRHRPSLVNLSRHGRGLFWIGGGASYFAYVFVLWACLHAPVAVVSSVRETSVLFAMALAVFFLGETLSVLRLATTLVIVCGVILLRLA